jgi:hypothetical protein
MQRRLAISQRAVHALRFRGDHLGDLLLPADPGRGEDVKTRTAIEQQLDEVFIPAFDGQVQRSPTVGVLRVRVAAMVDQEPDSVMGTCVYGHVQWGRTVLVFRIGIGARVEEFAQAIQVPRSRCLMQSQRL